MRTKSIKEFNSRLVAYSATAGAALLGAGEAGATGTVYDITSISPTNSLAWTANQGAVSQNFAGGPFDGMMLGNGHSAKGASTNNHFTTGSARLKGTNFNILTRGGVAVRFGFSQTIRAGSFTHAASAGKLASRYGLNGAPLISGGHFLPAANGAVTGYVGFKAAMNGTNYYGWLRVKVQANAKGSPDAISFVPEIGGHGIYGAYTKGPIFGGEAGPVPEPSISELGGLGLLALGAAGMREMRRRKSGASEKQAV